MNNVDLLLLLVLVAYGVVGYFRGFLLGSTALFALAFTLVVAWLFYKPVSSLLNGAFSPEVAPAAAFIGLVLLLYVTLSVLLNQLFRHVPKSVRKSKVNRIFGILPGLMDGLTMLVLVIIIVVTLPSEKVPRDAISDSLLGGTLLKAGTKVQEEVMEIFGGAMQAMAPFRTVKPDAKEGVKLPFHTDRGDLNPSLEKEMWALVNEERVKRGLSALEWDDRLRDVGRAHSRDMLKRGYFSHYSPEGKDVANRVNAEKIPYVTLGENLALAPTLPIAHQGLMDSPGHRANILHKEFGKIGIGAVEARPYGIMFTQVFTN